MRTPRPQSALRPAPLAAAVALALMPAFAMAADASRPPVATLTGPSVSVEQSGSGPFVVGGSTALPASPKVTGGTPGVFVTDGYLDFGSVQVGQSSRRLTTTLRSNGTSDYMIDSIGDYACGYGGYGGMMCPYGEFQCSTTCVPGKAYPPGTSCSFSATFSPTYTGNQYTYIAICDNAGGQPRYIDLYGLGFVPIVNVRPTTWDFGYVRVGQKSDVRTFVVNNPSNFPADIGAILTVGPYQIVTNDCTTPLSPFARCSVGVQFVPIEGGAAYGRLVVPSNAPIYYGAQIAPADAQKALISYGGYGVGSAVADLNGYGEQVAALDAPAVLDLGTQIIGGLPLTAPVTVTNVGNLPIALTTFTTSGGFGVTNHCPPILALEASCSLDVTFSAESLGDYTGALVIGTDSGTKTIQLSARTQPVPAPEIRVTPATITFGDRILGTTTPTQQVTVSNVGTAAATISKLDLSIDFTIGANTCGATLASSTSCVIDIAFRPVGFGPRSGELAITDSAPGSPHKVNLGGNGCRTPQLASSRSGANPCSP